MKLNKIDLKNIIAVSDDKADFILRIEGGNEIESLQFSAPQAAYEGLQQVSDACKYSLPSSAKKIYLNLASGQI